MALKISGLLRRFHKGSRRREVSAERAQVEVRFERDRTNKKELRREALAMCKELNNPILSENVRMIFGNSFRDALLRESFGGYRGRGRSTVNANILPNGKITEFSNSPKEGHGTISFQVERSEDYRHFRIEEVILHSNEFGGRYVNESPVDKGQVNTLKDFAKRYSGRRIPTADLAE